MGPQEDEEAWKVTPDELKQAVKRAAAKNTAPGSDGVTGKVLALIHQQAPEWFRSCYDTCLEGGVFPEDWKIARLVLLRKGEKP